MRKGKRFETIEEFLIDTGLLREMREHEKQAAIELGEWAEKREFSGPGGSNLPTEVLVKITKIYGDGEDKKQSD